MLGMSDSTARQLPFVARRRRNDIVGVFGKCRPSSHREDKPTFICQLSTPTSAQAARTMQRYPFASHTRQVI
jgi:hypothetical protein